MMQSVSNNLKKKIFCDRDAILKAFEAFDKDRGGSLSYAEFRDGLKTLGLPITTSQAKKLFAEFDKYNRGELLTESFAADVLGVKPGGGSTARSGRSSVRLPSPQKLAPVPGTAASLRKSRQKTQGGGPRMPAEFMPARSKSQLDGRMTRRHHLEPITSRSVRR